MHNYCSDIDNKAAQAVTLTSLCGACSDAFMIYNIVRSQVSGGKFPICLPDQDSW